MFNYKKSLKETILKCERTLLKNKKEHTKMVRRFLDEPDPVLAQKYLYLIESHAHSMADMETFIMELEREYKNL